MFKKKEADVGQRHQLIISYSENAGAVRAIKSFEKAKIISSEH